VKGYMTRVSAEIVVADYERERDQITESKIADSIATIIAMQIVRSLRTRTDIGLRRTEYHVSIDVVTPGPVDITSIPVEFTRAQT
jgi:hypothetical protein